MSIDLARDAKSDNRLPIIFDPNYVHPSSVIHDNMADEDARFSDLLNKVQRHSHVKSYCGCDGSGSGRCRFQYPHNISNETYFTWTIGQSGIPQGV